MRYFECLRSRSAPRRRDHRWSSQCERQYAAPAQTHGYLPYLSFIVLIASGYGTAQSDICQNTRTGLGGMATAHHFRLLAIERPLPFLASRSISIRAVAVRSR